MVESVAVVFVVPTADAVALDASAVAEGAVAAAAASEPTGDLHLDLVVETPAEFVSQPYDHTHLLAGSAQLVMQLAETAADPLRWT